MNKIIDDLNWRYACKQFDRSKKVSNEDFYTLVESLRLTASSYGLQPWKFVNVENQELRDQLVAVSWNQKQVADASHLIVFCAPKVIDEVFVDKYLNDIAKTRGQNVSDLEGFKKMLMSIPKKSAEEQRHWAKNQIYIALGSLLTVAANMRIDTCAMEGFIPSKYDEILGLEKMGLTSVVVCPIGYRSETDKYSQLKKVRFSQDDVLITL